MNFDTLGWSPEEIELTRAKLARVEEDWNDPAMNVYDEPTGEEGQAEGTLYRITATAARPAETGRRRRTK